VSVATTSDGALPSSEASGAAEASMVASGNDEASGCALLSGPASTGGAGGEQAATNEAAANVQNTERKFIERVALLRAHPRARGHPPFEASRTRATTGGRLLCV
jgi:hypothetical protein